MAPTSFFAWLMSEIYIDADCKDAVTDQHIIAKQISIEYQRLHDSEFNFIKLNPKLSADGAAFRPTNFIHATAKLMYT